MSHLVLHFTNKDETSILKLKFHLMQTKFVDKWLRLLKKSLDENCKIKEGGIYYGKSIHDQEELRRDLIDLSSKLKIDLKFPEVIDQIFLDRLHKEFEALPESVEASALNDKIHQYESSFGKSSAHFSLSVNFESIQSKSIVLANDLKDDEALLDEEDFEYFTPDKKWGGIYLNYATVGVPVLEAFLHKDHGRPVPQKKYKADFNVCFDPTSEFKRSLELSEWLKYHFGWDIKDKKLAIGYIPLALLENAENFTSEQIFQAVREHRILEKVEIS